MAARTRPATRTARTARWLWTSKWQVPSRPVRTLPCISLQTPTRAFRMRSPQRSMTPRTARLRSSPSAGAALNRTGLPRRLTSFDDACQSAAALGITITVASGDNGSSDGVSDGSDNVDFPSSSPHVLGCGGTELIASGNAIQQETVWNDLAQQGGASGGGVSANFALPSWQANAGVPAAPSRAAAAEFPMLQATQRRPPASTSTLMGRREGRRHQCGRSALGRAYRADQPAARIESWLRQPRALPGRRNRIP